MNVQQEPMVDIATSLSPLIRAQVPAVKRVLLGWPDRKWLQVEHGLPAVTLIDISEKGANAVSRFAVSSQVRNADGTGRIVYEKLRLRTLVQMSIFTNTKEDRDKLGWLLKQYFVTNYRVPILDFTQTPPAPTGEYLMLYYRGDHKEMQGDANFWRRDLTWDIQSRVLDASPAQAVRQINVSETVGTAQPVTSTPLPPAPPLVMSDSITINVNGTSVDTITLKGS